MHTGCKESGNQQWGRIDKTQSRPIGTVNIIYEENGSFQNHYRRDMFL
jgi:hypothetical protein